MSLVDDLLPHMRRVQLAERDLRDLALLWQMIEASAAISCPKEVESILPTLVQTRARFAALQSQLVHQLGEESLAELRDEMASAAQCTIDILVRNLYERTADVGFLATDDVLRAYCAATPEEREGRRGAFLHRLAEYRSKYTVYDDIVVLAPDGEILARLQADGAHERSADPAVAQAAAHRGYVERFAFSDLGADARRPALLYVHRVDDTAGRCIGVLVLRFASADEMERIFASVAVEQRQIALMLLDERDRVIASSDESHVPLGAKVQTEPAGGVALTTFGGREYLSVTRAAHGYQGYAGPAGWRAHAMVSLLTAFRTRDDGQQGDSADAVALDQAELQRIRREVDEINADLRRVVWNGRLVAGARGGAQAALKAALHQINEAGMRTRSRVATAIGDLYRTSLGRMRHQTQELARLAADIMDRNLYERANDCRWWALSPVLESVLAAPADAEGSARLNAVLAHINGLYTVYTRLVVFDADGIVRGASNGAQLVGTKVDDALRDAALRGGNSQRYTATPFQPSPLSGGAPTYVFVATVRSGSSRRELGGIAIVFNAEREFRAMLDDVLAARPGIAAFVGADGHVISSTDPTFPPGTRFPFAGGKAIVEHSGTRWAVARVRASGYREFKCSDGYDNGAHAIVALKLGSASTEGASPVLAMPVAQPIAKRDTAQEVALFAVGDAHYAVPAARVLEARTTLGLVRAPVGRREMAGLLEVPTQGGSCVVPVADARVLFDTDTRRREGAGVVLVIAQANAARRPVYGLLVDEVTAVLDVSPEQAQPVPAGLRAASPYLVAMLKLGRTADDAGVALAEMVDVDVLGSHVITTRAPIATTA